jgi:predicted amidohydrolase
MQDLTISLLQPVLVWEDREANLARLERMILDSSEATEVILLPEMFTTGFSRKSWRRICRDPLSNGCGVWRVSGR